MVVWVRNGCQCTGCDRDAAQHRERVSIVLHVASPGKDQNSELEVWFLPNASHFHTIITLRNRKSKHHKFRKGPSIFGSLAAPSYGSPANLSLFSAAGSLLLCHCVWDTDTQNAFCYCFYQCSCSSCMTRHSSI